MKKAIIIAELAALAVLAAVAQMLFPAMPNDRLLVVGNAMMERLDVDMLIANWLENAKPKSISEIAKMKSFVGV